MTFAKGNLGFFVVFLLLGGVLGAALGTLLVKAVPALAVINANLSGPLTLNLEIISISVRLSLSAIIGMAIGVFVFLRV